MDPERRLGLTRLALVVYRAGNQLFYIDDRTLIEECLLLLLRVIQTILTRILGCYLPFRAQIGRNLTLPHSLHGIFISQRATLGQSVTIYQNVTIGSDFLSRRATKHGAPRIADQVIVCAGALLIGNIDVGRNSIIGAGAVLTSDVPEDSVVRSADPTIIIPRPLNRD